MKRLRRAPARTTGIAASSGLAVDIVVRSQLWKAERGARQTVKRAVAAAAATVSTTDGELAIVLTDDSAIRALNRDWRGKDAPTNVLSFPTTMRPPPTPADLADKTTRRDRGGLLGDIVIAYETSAREAAAEGKPFGDHLAHLAVHGFLHLLGYDHEADEEAEAMEQLEIAVLARLGVANPYLVRDRPT